MEAFSEIQDDLSDDDYWLCLGAMWSGDEAPMLHREWWVNTLTSPRPHRHLLMDDQERQLLARLPARLQIFRGFSRLACQDGFSWTLDYEQARWFATNWTAENVRLRWWGIPSGPSTPMVAHAVVPKEKVIGIKLDRDEDEVLLFPGTASFARVEMLRS